jgi:hypothetical protein
MSKTVCNLANRRYFDSLELFEQTQYIRPLVKLALVQIQKGFDEKCTQKADAGWPVWHSVLCAIMIESLLCRAQSCLRRKNNFIFYVAITTRLCFICAAPVYLLWASRKRVIAHKCKVCFAFSGFKKREMVPEAPFVQQSSQVCEQKVH